VHVASADALITHAVESRKRNTDGRSPVREDVRLPKQSVLDIQVGRPKSVPRFQPHFTSFSHGVVPAESEETWSILRSTASLSIAVYTIRRLLLFLCSNRRNNHHHHHRPRNR
jgi:hypothetical protein